MKLKSNQNKFDLYMPKAAITLKKMVCPYLMLSGKTEGQDNFEKSDPGIKILS